MKVSLRLSLPALAFSFLSASRDVAGSLLFSTWEISPILAAWTGCLVTALVALSWKSEVRDAFAVMKREPSAVWQTAALNVLTIFAFATAFLAIEKVNPAVASVVDYGVTPLVTIALAVGVQREPLSRGTVIGSGISLCGVAALVLVTVSVTSQAVTTFWGVGFAVASAVSLAAISLINKRLLNLGVNRFGILAMRMPIAIFAGLPFVLWQGQWPGLIQSAALVLWCLGGITLPLYLLVRALQSHNLGTVAVYFFLIPVLTYLGAAVVLDGTFSLLGLAASLIVLLGAGIAERRSLPPRLSQAPLHVASSA